MSVMSVFLLSCVHVKLERESMIGRDCFRDLTVLLRQRLSCYCAHREGIWGSGSISPCILNRSGLRGRSTKPLHVTPSYKEC